MLTRIFLTLTLIATVFTQPVFAQSREFYENAFAELRKPEEMDALIKRFPFKDSHVPLARRYFEDMYSNPKVLDGLIDAFDTGTIKETYSAVDLAIAIAKIQAFVPTLIEAGLPKLPNEDLRRYMILEFKGFASADADICASVVTQALPSSRSAAKFAQVLNALSVAEAQEYLDLLTKNIDLGTSDAPALPALSAADLQKGVDTFSDALIIELGKSAESERTIAALQNPETSSDEDICLAVAILGRSFERIPVEKGGLAARALVSE